MTDFLLWLGGFTERLAVALECLFGTDAEGYFRGPAVMWQLLDEWESCWYDLLERSLRRDNRIAGQKYDKLGTKH